MSEDSSKEDFQHVVKKSKTKIPKIPEIATVALNAFSTVYAVAFGLIALYAAIAALIHTGSYYAGPFGGSLMSSLAGATILGAFPYAVSAVIFGLIANWTLRKITNVDYVKKAYGIATAITSVATVILGSTMISVILLAIIGAGNGSSYQGFIWGDMFVPALIATVVAAGMAFAFSKISSGKLEILPTFAKGAF